VVEIIENKFLTVEEQITKKFKFSYTYIFILCNLILVLPLLLLVVIKPLAAQDGLDVIRGNSANTEWIRFSDASHALYHHMAGETFHLLGKRAQLIADLHSLADWKVRQQRVGKTFMGIVGPFPKRTPLHARITKTVQGEGYMVEDIVYQSEPNFYVTGSLFIPDGVDEPAPTVIYVSGHASKGYRAFQHRILNLVKKGFIVFAYDPVGQGERLQYFNSKTGRSKRGDPTHQHSYPGAQAFITGSSMARYEIWDGICAVDYLLSRKKLVDPDRIGITGASGGGTQAAYIAAFDKRIYAAAPSNYITSFRRLLESVGPQDAEQNLSDEIAVGLDHADLLEVRTPKPTLMLTTTRDFFSIQGARETAHEVSQIYNAYGIPGRFDMVEDDAPHSYTRKNRKAMYAFFQKYLDNPGSSEDINVNPLPKKVLQVTHTGQVATSFPRGETVFSLNRKLARKEEKALQTSRKNLRQFLPKAVRAAKELSGYRAPDSVGSPIFTGRFQKDSYTIEKYFVMGEGSDYPIPYLLFVPDKPTHKALIYLSPAGKSAHLSQEEWLAQNGVTVLAPDLLGVGEMAGSDYGGDSYIDSTNYNTWFLSILIGRSIVGIQAGDVVRLAKLLQKRKGINEVYGLARKRMGPVLLYAAAFDSSIAHIALIKSYSSYRSIVMTRYYKPVYILSCVAGALQAYDLPDLAASLAPRKLLIVDMRDGSGAPAGAKTIGKDTAIIKAAYQHNNALGQLTITSGHDLFRKWMK
jgi:dienelactone hydrolase